MNKNELKLSTSFYPVVPHFYQVLLHFTQFYFVAYSVLPNVCWTQDNGSFTPCIILL